MNNGIEEIFKVLSNISNSRECYSHVEELEDEEGIAAIIRVEASKQSLINDILSALLLFTKSDKALNEAITELTGILTRWDNGKPVSFNEAAQAKIVPVSAQMLTKYWKDGANGVHLKALQIGGKGAKISFTKENWENFTEEIGY